MGYSATRVLALMLASTVVLASCQSSRIGALQTRQAPAPLTPAPSGQVTSGQLPPPTQPDAATQAAQQNGDFPNAPEGTQVAAAPTVQANTQISASSEPVTKESVLGRWVTQTGGGQCDVFLSLTKWSAGFRAASRGCPGDAASISSWNLSGNQVVLYDTNGNKLATLFKGSGKQLNGQTTNGAAISMSQS